MSMGESRLNLGTGPRHGSTARREDDHDPPQVGDALPGRRRSCTDRRLTARPVRGTGYNRRSGRARREAEDAHRELAASESGWILSPHHAQKLTRSRMFILRNAGEGIQGTGPHDMIDTNESSTLPCNVQRIEKIWVPAGGCQGIVHWPRLRWRSGRRRRSGLQSLLRPGCRIRPVPAAPRRACVQPCGVGRRWPTR